MVTKVEVIKLLKGNGIDKGEINEAFSDIESLAGFAETPEIQAALVARKFGIPIDTPKIIKGGKGGGQLVKTNLCEIDDAEIEGSHLITGYITNIITGLETQSGNPKVKVSLVEGGKAKCRVSASFFLDALEQFNNRKFKLYDKIKLENVNVYEYDYKGNTGRTITCGIYADVTKLKGSLLDKIPSFPDAKKNRLAMFKGMVLETDSSGYNGCPDCGKKAPDNGEYIDECKCGYNGMSTEITIYHAGVTDGLTDVSVTIFPRVGITNDDIAFKPVTVVGTKKSDDELTAMSVIVEKKATKMKKSKKAGTKSKITELHDYNAFVDDVDQLLEFYDDGHPKKELISVMRRKNKTLDKETIITLLNKMKKQGLITVKDNLIKLT